jgi:hypothetical protein
MPKPTRERIVRALLDRHGRTYAGELRIDLPRNTPSPLFRWLCASLLLSARIDAGHAMSAAGALARKGWTTPGKMARSTWRQRVTALNRSGYARYDESTARMLGDTVELLQREYDGDLRKLRDAAGCAPKEERKRLKAFKGIGDVGVDIFFREVQDAWGELYPFADKKALQSAGRLGLGSSARQLSRLVARKDFGRLTAALVRTDLEKDHKEVLAQAAKR